MAERICSFVDCDRKHNARGMCIHHYKKWQAEQRPCKVGCGRKSARQGYCRGHWDRWKKYGDPEAGPPIKARAVNGSPRPVYNSDGYRLIWAPGDPHAQGSGYAAEHRVVMGRLLG